MPNIKEQMAKRFELIQRLENLRTGNDEQDKLVNLLIEFLVDREIQMMALDESLHELDTVIKTIINRNRE